MTCIHIVAIDIFINVIADTNRCTRQDIGDTSRKTRPFGFSGSQRFIDSFGNQDDIRGVRLTIAIRRPRPKRRGAPTKNLTQHFFHRSALP